MKDFIKTLQAELIKIKSTKLLLLGYLLGAFIPVTYFIALLIDPGASSLSVEKGTIYIHKWFDNPLQVFTGLFIPLLIIMNASKIAQIDHKNKGWELMETQPVKKRSIFFSKYLILVWNMLKTILVYTLLSVGLAFLYSFLVEIDSNYSLEIPFKHIGYVISRLFVAGLVVTALQYVLSVIIPNFIWSLMVGFGLLLSHIFLFEFDFNLRWHPYYPLLAVGKHPEGSELGHYFLPGELLSLVYSVFLLLFGYNWYRFKGFMTAFFKSYTRLAISVVALFIAIISSYPFIKTKTLDPFHKTVIKGTVRADVPVNNVFLLDPLTLDTLKVIPINDDKFRATYDKNLVPMNYVLRFDEYAQYQVFFGTKDSIQIGFNIINKKPNIRIKGTRITENAQAIYAGQVSYYNFYLENNLDLGQPEKYADRIYESYEDDIASINSKVSKDHIVAREDFIKLSKDLITVKHANGWKEYLKKQQLYRPDITVVTPPKMEELLQKVDRTNESLLNNQRYVDFISSELKGKSKDSSATQLDLIAQVAPSVFRDKWLYSSMTTAITEQTENKKRDSIFFKYTGLLNDVKLVTNANRMRLQLNRLNKGQPATEINLIDLKGKEINLSDYKNQFVMIDTWASWCGPCKYQESFYVRKFEKFKNKNIVFMSINVDRKKNKWKEDVVDMNKDILQLRAVDVDRYMKDYDITSIPRFMLIAPDGTIASTKFLPPSNKNFDELLHSKLESSTP